MLHPFVSVPAASRPLVPVLALSSSIHAGLIVLAVASQSAVPISRVPALAAEQVQLVALHVARAALTTRHRAAVGQRGAASAPAEATPSPLPDLLLAFDVELPPTPAVTNDQPDFELADLALIGRGVSDDDPLALGIGHSASQRAPDVRYNAYDLSAVERGATPDPANPRPRYPTAMISRRAEVSFSVFFVVDTTGLVDRETLEVPRSVQEEFSRAVLDVLLRWRFAPAQMGGHRVRQHVQQPFLFKVE